MINKDQFGIKMEIEYIKSEDKKEEARQNEQFADDIIRSCPDYTEVMRPYKDIPLSKNKQKVLDLLKKIYEENSEKDPVIKEYGIQPRKLKISVGKEAKDIKLSENIEGYLHLLYENGHAQKTYVGKKPYYKPTAW